MVNCVRVLARTSPAIDESAFVAGLGGDDDLAARSVQAPRDLRALARRDAASLRRLSAELDDDHPILVPQPERDVSDVTGLVAIQRFLFAAGRERSALLAEWRSEESWLSRRSRVCLAPARRQTDVLSAAAIGDLPDIACRLGIASRS